MRLSDRVELIQQGPATEDDYGNMIPGEMVSLGMFPANVSHQTVERSYDSGHTARMIEELRAMLPPIDFDPATTQIVWDGNTYTTDGPPMKRRRNGATHHLTVALRLVEG